MWKKLFKPGGSDSENTLTTLINETGAPKELAEKVLRECNGDLALARQKLRGHNSSMAAAKDEKVPTSSSSYADAPPPYSEAVEGAMASPTPLPPPYITQEKDTLLGELKAVFPDHADERCCACFDPIRPDKSEGFSGEMIWQGLKAYHSECYLKSKGPKCEHCCFALIAFPEKGLSGSWGVYNGCKYHEECYNQYAGPRCSACFDVIRVDPENGFSGKWINDGNKQFHEECYKKKMFVEMRAKHS